VIVSEETGRISVAHNGRLVRDLDQERLRRILRMLLKLDRGDKTKDRPRPRSPRPQADGPDHTPEKERIAEDAATTPTSTD
jgi:diadenylate cyclase